jgi:hypothetical protein
MSRFTLELEIIFRYVERAASDLGSRQEPERALKEVLAAVFSADKARIE